jgi:hypothetical protein
MARCDTRLDEIAAYNLCNHDQNCKNLTLKNNIAAGFERIGFLVPTVCDAAMATYENNVAHSVEHGAWVLANNVCSGKQYFGNFHAYKTVAQGVLTFDGYHSIFIRNIHTLDCGMGATIQIGKNQDMNIINVTDSSFYGESAELPQDDAEYCIDINGFILAGSSLGGKSVPASMLSSLPYDKYKTYNNWFTEATMNNVTFKNWASGTRQHCSSTSTNTNKALGVSHSNSDHAAVNIFKNSVFDNVNHGAVAFIYDPPQSWANIRDCGNFPCTGPKNAVFKFENSTFTGSSTPSITNGTFQIIPNNPSVSDNIAACTLVTDWNAYLCYNAKIAQIVFESLDGDNEDRMLSPIYVLGLNPTTDVYTSYNNTLNSFMDHCWDGHYTCQKRLSRFPSITVMDSKVELY